MSTISTTSSDSVSMATAAPVIPTRAEPARMRARNLRVTAGV